MFSTTGTRAAIATALSSVSGVRGNPYRPRTLRAGVAWPEFERADRGPGDAWETTWRVLVVLAGDEHHADDMTDSLLPQLLDALDPVIFAEGVATGPYDTGAGQMFALQITGRGE